MPSLALSTYANGGFDESIWDCGGTWMDSSLAMAAHRGLCYDEYEPFVSDGTEATIVSEEKKGVCEYQLNYASTITGGRNAIKNKIKELGGVMVSYYADDLYMTFDNKSYYDPETTKYSGINHAVSVVGWDDNYSKSNFLAGYQPKKNGAWLVKGSWGVSSGTDGYYWISYEEAEMTDWVAFDLTESCDNNYHYPANKDNSIFYVSNENKMSGADVFTAKKTSFLTKWALCILATLESLTTPCRSTLLFQTALLWGYLNVRSAERCRATAFILWISLMLSLTRAKDILS